MQADVNIRGAAFLVQRNLILSEGLIAAPAAVCTDSLQHALAVCFVFCCVTLLTVLLGALIPRRVPFAFRILSYSVLAALVYIPSVLAAEYLIGGTETAMLYLPLLSAGLLLTTEHDRLFFASSLRVLLARLVCMLGGVCAVLLVLGCVRELLGAGTLYHARLLTEPPLPVLLTPACGMIQLTLLCCMVFALRGSTGEEETEHDTGD